MNPNVPAAVVEHIAFMFGYAVHVAGDRCAYAKPRATAPEASCIEYPAHMRGQRRTDRRRFLTAKFPDSPHGLATDLFNKAYPDNGDGPIDKSGIPQLQAVAAVMPMRSTNKDVTSRPTEQRQKVFLGTPICHHRTKLQQVCNCSAPNGCMKTRAG